MKKETYLKILQHEIDELNNHYDKVPESDTIERALTLGKINAYLMAKIFALELEE